MNKYLILEFKNAGLFPLRDSRGRLTKDKNLDINGRREREFEFIEPITVHQISNMLHVLFGERPKPIHRLTVYPKNDYLFDKALESYLRIDSCKDNNGKYVTQTTQTKKALDNSWSPEGVLYWERLKKFLGEHYSKFVSVLSEVFGNNIEDTKFSYLIPMIKSSTDTRITDLFNVLNNSGLKGLYDFIFMGIASALNPSKTTRITVVTGLDRVTKLDGKILVPISDEDIEKIRNNKGCANILDGGFVMIKGVKSANVINVHDFIRVKDISLDIKQ